MLESLYLARGAGVNQLSLWTKVVVFLIIIPLCAFVGVIWSLPLLLLLVMALTVWTIIGLRLLWVYLRVYLILFIVSIITLSYIFTPGSPVDRIIAASIWLVRFFIVLLAAVIFSIATDPMEIPMGMVNVGIPHKYGVTLMVAIRMLPLISLNLRKVAQAQRSRGMIWGVRHGRWRFILSNIMALIVPCILTTLEASVALSETLTTRGYSPDSQITRRPFTTGRLDWLFVGVTIIVLVISFWHKWYSV